MNSPQVPYSDLTTFGDLLKYLRKRARLSQRELSIAVGYSESQISRLESNERVPDRTSLLALFVPALHLQDEMEIVRQLVELAEVMRGQTGETQGKTVTESALWTAPVAQAPSARPASTLGDRFPTGEVTFLFTDIVGSTALWEQMPAEMKISVAQHHAILRKAIESNGGHIFQIVGDAFSAAFQLAPQGFQATLDAQRALCAAEWGPTGSITVRMGLHTGPAELDRKRDAVYAVSHTLNRAARVMSAGHGGQILLSEETAGLVRRSLPRGVGLKDLGEHRLKGLEKLEHIYQALAPDLPKDFPLLASQQSMRNHLPAQLTSFVGRADDAAEICSLLGDPQVRLVTLTGEGGCGKTRLALRAGELLAQQYEHGAWLVELSPLSDPGLVLPNLAAVFGIDERGERPLADRLLDYLRDKHLLLILDNCEHLMQAAAELAGLLLQGSSQLQLLATSRETLKVPGEMAYRVLPLSLPPVRQGTSPTRAEAEGYEAIQLFIERARSYQRGFALSDQNVPAVVHICRRLDGIPLAIELAAARLNILHPEDIASRLAHNLDLLASHARLTVHTHHQTLRAAIDWSYNLLDAPEKILLRRLAVFVNGWGFDAVEWVAKCAGIPQNGVLDVLTGLVDKSLVRVELRDQAETRYHMLETIQTYLLEKLGEGDEEQQARSDHLDFCISFVQQGDAGIKGAQQARWLSRFNQEQENLRGAMQWSEHRRQTERGLCLVSNLGHYWWMTWKLEERRWFEKFLQAAQELPNLRRSPDAAKALSYQGLLLAFENDMPAANACWQESLAIFQEQADHAGIGMASMFIGTYNPDLEKGLAVMQQGLTHSYQAEDDWMIAESFH